MKRKPSSLSFEARALAAAELRQAKGKRIIFGRDQDDDEDTELDPSIIHKLSK